MNDERQACLMQAKNLWQTAKTASLAVLDSDTGGPFCTLVNVAVTVGYAPLLLTSTLSRHTQCLDRDGRASLLATGALPADGDRLTAFRATLTGTLARTEDSDLKDRYLQHHPYAEGYAGFGDFGFWVMTPARLYVVGGFGRVFSYPADALVNS